MSNEKTQDQLRAELYQQMMKHGTTQHLCEVAMPGVVQPVKPDMSNR